MSALIDFISNNLVAGLILIAVPALIGYGVKRYRDHRDGQVIYNYLVSSKLTTSYTFRSTAAIASDTRIPESRVTELCGKHPKIKRNQKEKQSWRLDESQ